MLSENIPQLVFDESFFGAFVQYPAASGQIRDYKAFTDMAHAKGILVGVAADLMSLALLTPPGEWGADIVVGSSPENGTSNEFWRSACRIFCNKG